MRDLEEIARRQQERPLLVALARYDGETWPSIAEAAGMSRSGVIKLYKQIMAETGLDKADKGDSKK